MTLNSPNEWMEKGYHGNLEQLPEMTSIQRNLIEDFQGKMCSCIVYPQVLEKERKKKKEKKYSRAPGKVSL